MAILLPAARKLSDDVLEALRLRALRGCELGLTEAQLAEVLGVARETVCRWWSAYADRGVPALPQRRTGRPAGSGRALSDTQAEHLQRLVRTRQPEELGIAAPLGTRRAVRDLIRKEFDLALAERAVGRDLKRGGFTAKRPPRSGSRPRRRTAVAGGNVYGHRAAGRGRGGRNPLGRRGRRGRGPPAGAG